MEFLFPFKNMATHALLDLINKRESIRDYILTQKDEYPYTENYYLKEIDHYRNRLPNYENEILQLLNTANQEAIDSYFTEISDNISYLKSELNLDLIKSNVKKWNENTLNAYAEKVEKDTDAYFKSEDRKRKHLEEYESLDFGIFTGIGMGFGENPRKVKRINYNFYCIDEKPDLIDEEYCNEFHEFVSGLANEYFDIAFRYLEPYSKGEIKSQFEQVPILKPVVFVEGEHDITYIKKASELLEKDGILEKFDLRQRGGYANLDKLWAIYKEDNWETIPQKKLLLYDCDVNKEDDENGAIYKRTIRLIEENMITKGIENLFPNSLIEKAIAHKKAFVDITKVDRIKRGIEESTTKYEVNSDEKKNLCDWICENASKEDFENFKQVFALIDTVL